MLTDSMMRIRDAAGTRLQHINLGGGFPVNYLRGSSVNTQFHVEQREMFSADFEPMDAMREAWRGAKRFAEDCGAADLFDGLTLVLEPGRSIIADTAVCLSTVRNVKHRPLKEINDSLAEAARERVAESRRLGLGRGSGVGSSSNEYQSILGGLYKTRTGFSDRRITSEHWLLTDAGFNILLSMETYKWYYHMISAERPAEPHDFPYKVAGPLCDGGDVYFDIEGEGRLPEYRRLPENVQPGEILAMLNTGAYTLAQASQYNARFLPAVVLIKANGESELIRKRDGFEDLILNDL